MNEKSGSDKKIIVAHPYKQHSHRVAIALTQSNMLFAYSTTVYDKEHSFVSAIKRILPLKYKKLIEKKKCNSIPNEKVCTFCELRGFGFIVITRLPIINKIYRFYGAILTKRFGVKVAKYAIENEVDAVIMYDTTACSCFEYIKNNSSSIKCILDVSSNASMERLNLYNSVIHKDSTSELKKEFPYLWNASFQHSNMRELECADYFLVPSEFSKKSLINQKVDERRIYKVPYGVDGKQFQYCPKRRENRSQIKLVYTGVISFEKGVNYLLQAISELPKHQYSIDLMGAYTKDSSIVKEYEKYENIRFRGYVTHDELAEIYQDADAFIMASLGEGFTLSGLEAMSCGLPILCSENSGINDAVMNYKNGIVFKICDVEAIKNVLVWCYDHQNELPLISKEAYETSLTYTWDAYYKNINIAVADILEQ